MPSNSGGPIPQLVAGDGVTPLVSTITAPWWASVSTMKWVSGLSFGSLVMVMTWLMFQDNRTQNREMFNQLVLQFRQDRTEDRLMFREELKQLHEDSTKKWAAINKNQDTLITQTVLLGEVAKSVSTLVEQMKTLRRPSEVKPPGAPFPKSPAVTETPEDDTVCPINPPGTSREIPPHFPRPASSWLGRGLVGPHPG